MTSRSTHAQNQPTGSSDLRVRFRAMLFASTLLSVPILLAVWLVSWNSTIGPVTFWSPPHVALYVVTLVAGMLSGFGGSCVGSPGPRRFDRKSVFAQLYPAGWSAWMGVSCATFVLLSLPLDYWWHANHAATNDLRSVPHFMLAVAITLLQSGWLARILDCRARTTGPQPLLRVIQALATGMLLLWLLLLTAEFVSLPNLWHGTEFYVVTGTVIPVVLVMAARASGEPWSATAAAAGYMVVTILAILTLQLLPARPSGGAAVNQVAHMLPLAYPLLLVVPAVTVDLILRRSRARSTLMASILLACSSGIAFTGTMLVSHWFFADFLLSPAARNALFAADQWPYYVELGGWRYEYWTLDAGTRQFAGGMIVALGAATVSSGTGLWLASLIARVGGRERRATR